MIMGSLRILGLMIRDFGGILLMPFSKSEVSSAISDTVKLIYSYFCIVLDLIFTSLKY